MKMTERQDYRDLLDNGFEVKISTYRNKKGQIKVSGSAKDSESGFAFRSWAFSIDQVLDDLRRQIADTSDDSPLYA